MSNRAARGEKRKCQNEECDASFYDLNRETFECPICGTEFDHEAHANALEQKRNAVPDYVRRRQARDLPIVAATDSTEQSENDDDDEVSVADEEAGDGEVVAEDETAAAAAADTLLEEDDDDEQDPLASAIPLAEAEEEQ